MTLAVVTSGEQAFHPTPLGTTVPVLNQTGSNEGYWSRFIVETIWSRSVWGLLSRFVIPTGTKGARGLANPFSPGWYWYYQPGLKGSIVCAIRIETNAAH
jgi:hypothetical protein